jgi:hypothetical protein
VADNTPRPFLFPRPPSIPKSQSPKVPAMPLSRPAPCDLPAQHHSSTPLRRGPSMPRFRVAANAGRDGWNSPEVEQCRVARHPLRAGAGAKKRSNSLSVRPRAARGRPLRCCALFRANCPPAHLHASCWKYHHTDKAMICWRAMKKTEHHAYPTV